MPLINNMPGGRIFSAMGGYLNVVSPFTQLMQRLDVASWEIDQDPRLFHKGYSGSVHGAILSRVVALDWQVRLKIWWDLGNPPKNLLISGWGCGLQLGMGSKAGQASLGITPQRFWLAPSGLCGGLHTRDSSEGENDDVVTADAVVKGNAPIFLMPDDLADFLDWQTQVVAKGEYVPVPNITVMQ